MAPGCVSLAALMALTVLGATTVVTSNTLHHHMSVAELQRVFHVDSHAQVPEYQVVPVHSAAAAPSRPSAGGSEDETKHVRLSAFGQDMKLKLKKAVGLFKGDSVKMWSVHPNVSEPHEVQYVDETQDDDIGDTYQDEENMAALLLQHEDDGALAVEGTIGHDLVVKPVPASVRQHLDDVTKEKDDVDDDDEMFLDDEGEDLGDDVSLDTGRPLRSLRSARSAPAQHIVYKRSRAGVEDDPLSDYAFMEPDHLSKKFRTKRSITKREAPYVIYPEILVIVDYDGYRLHGGDNVQIKRYFVSFWNGVDLRYKLLKGPKIRISIAGIIISRGRDATPYLERNRVGRDAIDSAAALTDMGKYLFRERRLPVYDIAVAVTKYDMCRRRKGGRCTKGTAGFAYVGGACVVNKRLEKVNSVAIIEDTGGFSGIIVGAHEVGHLLGAVHDGSPPPSYLGGPGAEKCRWEDGFIMSDLRHTEKGFKWSACSVTSFHHFLNGDTATCLFNSPHEDESLPRVLPGKLLTLDAQCRKDRGTSACFKDDRVCAQLFCFDAGSGYCVAYRPAAEGSSCGDGQYCINGRCTTEHENIIPDYSQNTPSYLRRIDGDAAATQSRPVYASLNQTTHRNSWNDYASTKAIDSTTTTTTTTTPLPPTPSTSKYSYSYNAYTSTKNAYGFNAYTTTTTTKSPYYSVSSTAKNNPYAYTNKYYPTPSTVKPYDYKSSYTQTTKNPFSYNKVTTTKSPFIYNKAATTKSPYDFSNLYKATKRTSLATTTKDPYNQYKKAVTTTTTTKNPYNYNANHISTTKKTYLYNSQYYSTTVNPYAATSTSKYTPYNAYATTTKKTSSPYYQTSATQNAEFVVNANDTKDKAKAGDTECVDTATNLSGSMTCTDFLLRYAYQYCQNKYMKQNCCASHRKICESMATS